MAAWHFYLRYQFAFSLILLATLEKSIGYAFWKTNAMLLTINNSVRIKERKPSTMSLYSRGSMRSSSQNSLVWGPSPIFYLPSNHDASRHPTPPGSILDTNLFLPPSEPSECENTESLDDCILGLDYSDLLGHLQESMQSESEILGRLRLPRFIAGFETSEGDDLSVMATFDLHGNNIHEIVRALEEIKTDTGYAITKFDIKADERTDTALERMSEIKEDFNITLTNAERQIQADLRPLTPIAEWMRLGVSKNENRLLAFDNDMEEDTFLHPDLNFEDPVAEARTALQSRTDGTLQKREEIIIRKGSSESQRSGSSGNKEEIQSAELVVTNSGSNKEDVVFKQNRPAVNRDRDFTSDDDNSIYLTEYDEEDGGATIGDVKTRYQELGDLHASLSNHPIIRQWGLSKFMEEWMREDGLLQHMLELEKRVGF